MTPLGRKMADRPDAALRAWLAGNPEAKATWKHRRPDLPDQSMTGHDAELRRLALVDGWTDAADLARLTAAHHADWAGKPVQAAPPPDGMLDSPAVPSNPKVAKSSNATAQKRAVISNLLKLQPERNTPTIRASG